MQMLSEQMIIFAEASYSGKNNGLVEESKGKTLWT